MSSPPFFALFALPGVLLAVLQLWLTWRAVKALDRVATALEAEIPTLNLEVGEPEVKL